MRRHWNRQRTGDVLDDALPQGLPFHYFGLMRLVPHRIHRLLDFVTVVAFALAPSLLGLTGPAATLAYALAVVHLTLTLLTRFPGGASRPIPLVLHGAVEAVVGPVLLLLPRIAGWSGVARLFYIGAGVVILAVWVLSEYKTGTGGHGGE